MNAPLVLSYRSTLLENRDETSRSPASHGEAPHAITANAGPSIRDRRAPGRAPEQKVCMPRRYFGSRGPAIRIVLCCGDSDDAATFPRHRSEEHTSELQSLRHLVCRLLLEKKKKKHKQ